MADPTITDESRGLAPGSSATSEPTKAPSWRAPGQAPPTEPYTARSNPQKMLIENPNARANWNRAKAAVLEREFKQHTDAANYAEFQKKIASLPDGVQEIGGKPNLNSKTGFARWIFGRVRSQFYRYEGKTPSWPYTPDQKKKLLNSSSPDPVQQVEHMWELSDNPAGSIDLESGLYYTVGGPGGGLPEGSPHYEKHKGKVAEGIAKFEERFPRGQPLPPEPEGTDKAGSAGTASKGTTEPGTKEPGTKEPGAKEPEASPPGSSTEQTERTKEVAGSGTEPGAKEPVKEERAASGVTATSPASDAATPSLKAGTATKPPGETAAQQSAGPTARGTPHAADRATEPASHLTTNRVTTPEPLKQGRWITVPVPGTQPRQASQAPATPPAPPPAAAPQAVAAPAAQTPSRPTAPQVSSARGTEPPSRETTRRLAGAEPEGRVQEPGAPLANAEARARGLEAGALLVHAAVVENAKRAVKQAEDEDLEKHDYEIQALRRSGQWVEIFFVEEHPTSVDPLGKAVGFTAPQELPSYVGLMIRSGSSLEAIHSQGYEPAAAPTWSWSTKSPPAGRVWKWVGRKVYEPIDVYGRPLRPPSTKPAEEHRDFRDVSSLTEFTNIVYGMPPLDVYEALRDSRPPGPGPLPEWLVKLRWVRETLALPQGLRSQLLVSFENLLRQQLAERRGALRLAIETQQDRLTELLKTWGPHKRLDPHQLDAPRAHLASTVGAIAQKRYRDASDSLAEGEILVDRTKLILDDWYRDPIGHAREP